MKIVAYIVAAILVFFGVLFIWGAFSPQGSPGWILIGLVSVAVEVGVGVENGVDESVGPEPVLVVRQIYDRLSDPYEACRCESRRHPGRGLRSGLGCQSD